MGTEKADVTGIPYTNAPFAYDDKWWNELLSISKSSPTPEPQPLPLDSDDTFFHGLLASESESSTVRSNPRTHSYPCFRRSENTGHRIPVDYASGSSQDTRRPSVLLDTRQWSPSPSFANPRATSKSQFSLMDVGSDVSLSLSHGCSNGFGETFTSGNMLAAYMAPKPQAILHTQPVPDLSPGFSYHRANLGTDLHQSPSRTSGALVLSPSSGSTEDVTDFVSDQRQPLNPIVIYRPPERKCSGRRRSQRACAINVEGMWIDKDNINFGADHGSSMISVHECQWAASGNPCGMWIIPSRPSVGNHIRKWHTGQRYMNSTVKCLWDGCDEMMHKDSVNRHVVTVHFGEAFHCQGCDQEFPRKDVYNQHVEVGEACRVAGAEMVYGTEHRVIDTRQALHRGCTIRYGR